MPRGNPPIRGWRRRDPAPAAQRAEREALFSRREPFHSFPAPALAPLRDRAGEGKHRGARRRPGAAREADARTASAASGSSAPTTAIRRWPTNVEVVTAGIDGDPARIVDTDGVSSGRRDHLRHRLSGHRPADGRHVRGRDGGPGRRRPGSQAHSASPSHGFPNFFMLLGPNTGLGHTSVLLMIEAQLGYLCKLLRHPDPRRAVEPTPRPKPRSSPRSSGGRAAASGPRAAAQLVPRRTGRNSTLWPGTVRAYRRRLARFAETDWRGDPARPPSRSTPAGGAGGRGWGRGPDDGAPTGSRSMGAPRSSPVPPPESVARSRSGSPSTAARWRSPTRTRRASSRPPS